MLSLDWCLRRENSSTNVGFVFFRCFHRHICCVPNWEADQIPSNGTMYDNFFFTVLLMHKKNFAGKYRDKLQVVETFWQREAVAFNHSL